MILNPAPARPLPAQLLRRVYLLTPNQSEAELLTGVTVDDEVAAAKAADQLLARGVKNVIITMGLHGAFVAGKELAADDSRIQVKAVDATGAGDIFNGTLAVALSQGRSLLEAARLPAHRQRFL